MFPQLVTKDNVKLRQLNPDRTTNGSHASEIEVWIALGKEL